MNAMEQPTFADLEYERKKRKTRLEKFLERMDRLIPWEKLEERIRPLIGVNHSCRHPQSHKELDFVYQPEGEILQSSSQ